MSNETAVTGFFSFPKWAMGLFSIMLVAMAGFTYNAGIVNSRDIAVLQQRVEQSRIDREELRQDLKEIKEQLKIIQNSQNSQEQVQNFILENLAADKRK